MATYAQRRAALLLEQERLLSEDFRALAGRIRQRILARADRAGTIPLQDWSRLDADITALILGYLLGGVVSAPFRVSADGTFEALSDFARRYDAAIYALTVLALQEQADRLRRQYPADIERRLRAARFTPFARPDLLPTSARTLYNDFVPQYAVVRADNRALMDRMIAAAGETRRKTSLLLNQLLAEGKPAQEVADTLGRFLTDGLNTANQSYGTKGIYESRRLLLSEAHFAYSRASVMAAVLNPAIKLVDVVLSPYHRDVDVCDGIAGNSPYTLDEVPVPGYHAHCQCGLRFRVGKVTQTTIEKLRNSELINVKGALSPDFAQLLLRGR